MAGVDLAACMDEIAARVRDSADMFEPGPGALLERAYAYPISTVSPPCFIVGYPDEPIDVNATFAGGSDRLTIPCWAVFGAADTLSARDGLSSFLLGIQDALDGEAPGVWQSALVQNIRVESLTPDDTEVRYLAALFSVDVLT